MTTDYKPSFNPMRVALNDSVWKIGYFVGATEQGTEGDFRWRELSAEGVFVSGIRHPGAGCARRAARNAGGVPCESDTVVCLRGVDKSCRYRVTSNNNRSSYELAGWQMADEDIRVRLNAPMTSELLTYSAIM